MSTNMEEEMRKFVMSKQLFLCDNIERNLTSDRFGVTCYNEM
jgi:hypothetical protein